MLTPTRSSIRLLLGPVADRERRPDRPLGVVLVRDRRAEDRHHRVADELLDRAAEPLELGLQPRVVGIEEGGDVLGVHRLGLDVNPARSAKRTVTTLRSRRADMARV